MTNPITAEQKSALAIGRLIGAAPAYADGGSPSSILSAYEDAFKEGSGCIEFALFGVCRAQSGEDMDAAVDMFFDDVPDLRDAQGRPIPAPENRDVQSLFDYIHASLP